MQLSILPATPETLVVDDLFLECLLYKYYAQSIYVTNFYEDDHFTRIPQFLHKIIYPMTTIQSCDEVAEAHYYTLKLQISLLEPVYASCEKLFTLIDFFDSISTVCRFAQLSSSIQTVSLTNMQSRVRFLN